MEWCDSSVESLDTLREETEAQPELWEAKPCHQRLQCISTFCGGHLLSYFTFSCQISVQKLCPAGLASVLSLSHCGYLSHSSWSPTCFQTEGGEAQGSCAILRSFYLSADRLGTRMEQESGWALTSEARLCYVCSGSVERLVECWAKCQPASSPMALQVPLHFRALVPPYQAFRRG